MILWFYNIIKSHILVDTGGGVILFNFELGSISPNLLNLNKPLFDNNRKTPLRLILSKNLEFETNWCQKYNHTFNLLYRSLIPLNRHYLCHKSSLICERLEENCITKLYMWVQRWRVASMKTIRPFSFGEIVSLNRLHIFSYYP